jgi:hypothetical protein
VSRPLRACLTPQFCFPIRVCHSYGLDVLKLYAVGLWLTTQLHDCSRPDREVDRQASQEEKGVTEEHLLSQWADVQQVRPSVQVVSVHDNVNRNCLKLCGLLTEHVSGRCC